MAKVDNNVRTAKSSVLSSGHPRSVDLLNHEVRAGASTARTEYGGDRIGVGFGAAFYGFNRGTLTLP